MSRIEVFFFQSFTEVPVQITDIPVNPCRYICNIYSVQEETWLKALPTTGFSPKGQ